MTVPAILSAFDYIAPSPATTNVQEFRLSGVWEKPPGANMVMVELWGGGGGGASATANANPFGGGGGGGGAYNMAMFRASELPSRVEVAIAAGAIGATAGSSTQPGPGGATVFGTPIYASSYNALGSQTTSIGGAYLTAYGGAGGGVGGGTNSGWGGQGGGPLNGTQGTAGPTSITGGYAAPGGATGGGSFGSASIGNGTNRASVWGGGTGDYAGSGSGGGTSVRGGGGGGHGGYHNATALPVPPSDGGGNYSVASGGGQGMYAIGSVGQAGGWAQGGGGGPNGRNSAFCAPTHAMIYGSGVGAKLYLSSYTDTQTYSTSGLVSYTQGTNHNGIQKIIHDGTQFVGISRRRVNNSNSAVFVSADGDNWTRVTNTPTLVYNKQAYQFSISDIAYGNGVYVGTFQNVGSFSFGWAVSTDLNTWVVTRQSQYAYAVEFLGGYFWALSINGLARSTDGYTWTTPSGSFSGSLYAIAYDAANATYVVQTSTTSVYRSDDDGASFSLSPGTAVAGNQNYRNTLAYSSDLGMWLMTGASTIYTSITAGLSWTLQTDGTTDSYAGVVYGTIGGVPYWIVTDVTANATMLLYSSDGVAWTAQASGLTNSAGGTGGAGGFPAGGGGGGGAGSGGTGGAGGRGGDGFARITSW